VNGRLGAAAQQEDKKKNRNRNTYPPWAMAPIVSATKPAVTTIATFDSIDNFITFPFVMAATRRPVSIFPFQVASNLSALWMRSGK
jgi:hypothetical protein